MATAPLTVMVLALMTLTAIGSYGFLTRAHLQHQVAAQEAVDRDAAPLAQRIVLAEADVRDLDGRIARLDAMVKTATARGYTKAAMRLVDDQAKSRADLVVQRQAAAERLADLKVQDANVDAQRARVTPDTGITPLDGRNRYVIHFAKGALPPVNEFWSVTVYDLQGFTVPNPTNRYTLGDRSNLKPNVDGSLNIYLQSENPGADKEVNWLPTPSQPFSLHARLYSPRRAAIDGTWAMPPVEKVL